MGSSGRRAEAPRALDLTAEEPAPGARADLDEQATSSIAIGGKLLFGSVQFNLQGAKSWAVTHVVLSVGAPIPACVCLVIGKVAGAPPAVTLWVSLGFLLVFTVFTAVLQVAARRGAAGPARSPKAAPAPAPESAPQSAARPAPPRKRPGRRRRRR